MTFLSIFLNVHISIKKPMPIVCLKYVSETEKQSHVHSGEKRGEKTNKKHAHEEPENKLRNRVSFIIRCNERHFVYDLGRQEEIIGFIRCFIRCRVVRRKSGQDLSVKKYYEVLNLHPCSHERTHTSCQKDILKSPMKC